MTARLEERLLDLDKFPLFALRPVRRSIPERQSRDMRMPVEDQTGWRVHAIEAIELLADFTRRKSIATIGEALV